MSSLLSIQNVLISVFNKSKILNFAQSLSQKGIRLLSTDGTAQILSKSGITTHKISDYIKLPELMNHRIKTLHHKIYAGILCRKGIDDSILHQYHIQSIDMVIIDFYPFDSILRDKKHSQEEILEYIDIGGPNIARAAAKNYKNIVIVIDKNDYKDILNEINQYNGSISLKTRLNLAAKAFKYITQYDLIISNYFNTQLSTYSNQSDSNNDTVMQCYDQNFPNTLDCMNLKFIKKQNMRYGENPHQQAALYIEKNIQQTNRSVATAHQLQGKPLSYNNVVDMDTALECVKMFNEPTCVIVKHASPCGVATSNTIDSAYNKAYQADPISAFGAIIALNRSLDKNTAQAIINNKFTEAIIAPNIHQDSLTILSNKKHIRVLSSGIWDSSQTTSSIYFKRINGGLLIQDYDSMKEPKYLNIVTICRPTDKEIQDALFCWKIVKFVKSNAIVCGKNHQTTGISTGQTNRIDAVKIATASSIKFQNKLLKKIPGLVMASDAFFPFPDGVQIAAKNGISCIIQPGGSIQDTKVIHAANQCGISMIFTHTRHFSH